MPTSSTCPKKCKPSPDPVPQTNIKSRYMKSRAVRTIKIATRKFLKIQAYNLALVSKRTFQPFLFPWCSSSVLTENFKGNYKCRMVATYTFNLLSNKLMINSSKHFTCSVIWKHHGGYQEGALTQLLCEVRSYLHVYLPLYEVMSVTDSPWGERVSQLLFEVSESHSFSLRWVLVRWESFNVSSVYQLV